MRLCERPPAGLCRCGPEQAARYQRRISGPLRDRIDIQIEVPALPHDQLLDGLDGQAETSAQVRQRVEQAWDRQQRRQAVAMPDSACRA